MLPSNLVEVFPTNFKRVLRGQAPGGGLALGKVSGFL